MQSRLSLFTEYAELDSECLRKRLVRQPAFTHCIYWLHRVRLSVFIECTESDSLYLLTAQSQTLCIYCIRRVRLSVFIEYAESGSLYSLITHKVGSCVLKMNTMSLTPMAKTFSPTDKQSKSLSLKRRCCTTNSTYIKKKNYLTQQVGLVGYCTSN